MSMPLFVLGCGAVTSVGWTAAQTCAAIRAGITGFLEWDLSYASDEFPIIQAAPAPLDQLPRDNLLHDRLVELATTALDECLGNAKLDSGETVVFLGTREPFRAHRALPANGASLLPAIEKRMGKRFHPDSRSLAVGRTAAINGLLLAPNLFATGRSRACIVGGVDSYLNLADWKLFSDSYRFKSEDVPKGFIPGEGAAFVAISAIPKTSNQGQSVQVLGAGLVDEDPSTSVKSAGHPTGKGLSRAMREAVQASGLLESQIECRVSDLNGEEYAGVDSMLAVARFYRTRRETLPVTLPASCVGDIGAAAGALSLIVANMGITKRYSRGKVVMCESSSDEGQRGAALVSAI